MKKTDLTPEMIEYAKTIREKQRIATNRYRKERTEKTGEVQKTIWTYPPDEQMKKSGFTKAVVIYLKEEQYNTLKDGNKILYGQVLHDVKGKYSNNKDVEFQEIVVIQKK